MTGQRITAALLLAFFAAAAWAADAPLTPEQVEDYIRTRIATHKLQMNMKAHAGDYDDVVQAFYHKRKALLQRRGWSVAAFESTQGRVLAAETAMDDAEEQRDDLADLERRKREIRNNPHFTAKQKRQLIQMEDKLHNSADPMIQKTKPDWPAVRTYRHELEQLIDWVAGNIPNPPKL